ncbi:BRO1-domain-containing protein [Trichodelitschia bisporula]|uniref:BRO domain-containing protein 1 n=1 Tax=Trichodelitschia bisporula TaxID=703511 RepID=A0A6G1HI74_9PEZI|nr:BRO1-domain-containing protein [Trichodelitschia bisporula]
MLSQTPMLSSPLKQTNEIDWITPLKGYIRDVYGDDPERYSEECAMLNRLRQDMRGAGKDSASGRDLLYRYYGQLELLDLRFPVDENHIKISFTWFDAFTHKPTSQFSLAYEKASIIFNISAVLSCHAAHQNRHEDTGLKTAYHSFQAAAGMFTYINENFLHAPSADLSRETVKTLIQLMLAQGQEVFLEKQIADNKKVGLLAKLASQAAFLYSQALEGVQENVTKAIFERVWLLVTQIKANHLASVAQYYQALADNDANAHGVAICRLQVAEAHAREAHRVSSSFPATVPANSNLTSETGVILSDITRRQLAAVQEKFAEFSKDNDFIYHQPVPNEASLAPIPKLPAAKAMPVSELYQGQDIQRIIGPDIFQRIVPMAVTESASLYDEEKAKLVRAEAERVEVANDEMAASLDILRLPGSLDILKGAKDWDMSGVDPEFLTWCEELAGHAPFPAAFDELGKDKAVVLSLLDQSAQNLDTEESVCEKMRSKYGDDWTQQPSARLTVTLRNDIKSYRAAIEEASTSDAQLYSTYRQYEADFDEMRSAGETDEADVLYQRALIKAGAARGKGRGIGSPAGEGNLLDDDFDSGPTVAAQIENIEELMKKLRLVRKEREQVLRDLKEMAHNDDISNVLILNKKSIANQDSQIFQAELVKFSQHQKRIQKANLTQQSLIKELTRSYNALLQDKRVRVEQNKYEAFSRQRSSVLQRYRKVYQAFNDLVTGLMRAQGFYSEMKETVESLHKNVETFVNNRRSEGGQLLASIEAARSYAAPSGGLVDWERERLQQIMDRMSIEPERPGSTSSPIKSSSQAPLPQAPPVASRPAYTVNSPPTQYSSPQSTTPYSASSDPQSYLSRAANGASPPPQHQGQRDYAYNPGTYRASPPPVPQDQYAFRGHQHSGSTGAVPAQYGQRGTPQPAQRSSGGSIGYASHTPQPQTQQGYGQMPPGWQPPPPPPGPPPGGPGQGNFALQGGVYPSGPGGYSRQPQQRRGQGSAGGSAGDPWEGLKGWAER